MNGHDGQVRAILRWVPPSRGGRQRPPEPAVRYAAPARFESDPNESLGAWSLRIVEARELRGPEVIEARVAFVMPDAPVQLLVEGERFELLEGKRVVAKGVVLPPKLTAPDQITEFELALLG
jgi:hypothetical protein